MRVSAASLLARKKQQGQSALTGRERLQVLNLSSSADQPAQAQLGQAHLRMPRTSMRNVPSLLFELDEVRPGRPRASQAAVKTPMKIPSLTRHCSDHATAAGRRGVRGHHACQPSPGFPQECAGRAQPAGAPGAQLGILAGTCCWPGVHTLGRAGAGRLGPADGRRGVPARAGADAGTALHRKRAGVSGPKRWQQRHVAAESAAHLVRRPFAAHLFLADPLAGPLSLTSARRLSCTGGAGERFIFDPAFRDQFLTLNASEGFQQLLAGVPAAFCGSEQRLVAAVQLLSRELEREFAAKGCSLPPWRSLQATLSKWRPATPARQQAPRAQQPSRAPASASVPMLPRRSSNGFLAAGETRCLQIIALDRHVQVLLAAVRTRLVIADIVSAACTRSKVWMPPGSWLSPAIVAQGARQPWVQLHTPGQASWSRLLRAGR